MNDHHQKKKKKPQKGGGGGGGGWGKRKDWRKEQDESGIHNEKEGNPDT